MGHLSQNEVVEESAKTKKTREKLKKLMDRIDSFTTQQAIERKLAEIHRWIARNSIERIPLKSKEISLFDENKHAARVSQRVKNLTNVIRSKMSLDPRQQVKKEDTDASN